MNLEINMIVDLIEEDKLFKDTIKMREEMKEDMKKKHMK
jgi:hypothetical protein